MVQFLMVISINVGVHSLTIPMGFDFSLKNKKQQTSLGTPINGLNLENVIKFH